MLAGKRRVFVVLAAAALVLGSGAASADIVKVTIEGVVTPYTDEVPGAGYQEGSPFNVTLEVFVDVVTVDITPGPPDTVVATGAILSCNVIGDTWTESYDAASFLAGYGSQANTAFLMATYVEDPVTGDIIPLFLLGGAEVSGSTGDAISGTSVEAVMLPFLDPSTGMLMVSAGVSETVWDLSGSTETGYSFLGAVTDYSVCDGVVPEPASLSLLALGIGAVVARKMRKRA